MGKDIIVSNVKVENSLAGTDRKYFVPCKQFRVSCDASCGEYKVHIPRANARVEKNRVVVMFSRDDLTRLGKLLATL